VRIPSTLLKSSARLLFGISAVVYSKPADAVMILNATESGGGVVFSYSGTLNTTGLTYRGKFSSSSTSEVDSSKGYFWGNGAGGFYDEYDDNANSFAVPFGAGPFYAENNSTGDIFSLGYYGNDIYVPSSYSSGTTLAGSVTFTGQSFASLGMTPGTYINTLSNNDTITLNVGTTAVPGPLPILGIPAVLLYSRNLKKRIKARREASNTSLV